MKRIIAALLCGLLPLALIGCRPGNGVTAQATSAASSSGPGTITADADSSIQIHLDRVEKIVKANNGQPLVRYAYDKPTVTIFHNPTAQAAIQSALDKVVQNSLISYAVDELLPMARNAYQAKNTSDLPYSSQLNLSIQRTDDAVISILTDQISDAGGAHGEDYRSARNYDTKTGKPLTFAMLGSGFRMAATKLVTAQAKAHAKPLFPHYQKNISHVVLDGTENPQKIYHVNTAVTPTFYLTNDAIVFISREYELQSYAAGIIEFPIPYTDFGSTLHSAYLPDIYGLGYDREKQTTNQSLTDNRAPPFRAKNMLVPAGTLQGNGWTLSIPNKWAGKVYVKLNKSTATFYEYGCYKEMGGGRLFTVMAYKDDSYVELPDYELLSIEGHTNYVAVNPTDVQYVGASSESAQRYNAFSSQVEDVLHTFTLSN